MKPISPLQSRILEQIHQKRITPKPAWQYRGWHLLLWSVIMILIILSSIFAAFFIQDSVDLFQVRAYGAPVIFTPGIFWIILIILVIYGGVRVFQKTPTGYRHPIVVNLLVWGLLVLLLIPTLRISGIGPLLHSRFVDAFPSVADFIYQASSWNSPSHGRIAGTIISVTEKKLIITSLDGTTWDVSISDARISLSATLRSGERVRIVGTTQSGNTFVADRVLPWFGKGAGKRGIFQF